MHDHQAVQRVLARYVRAADARDGQAMAALFVPQGRVEIYVGHRPPGLVATLVGAQAIGQAVAALMPPHPPNGWSHHVTSDHLIEVDADRAQLDAQFIMFQSIGDVRGDGNRRGGGPHPHGSLAAREAGYYRTRLVRVGLAWLIEVHCIYHDLPPVT